MRHLGNLLCLLQANVVSKAPPSLQRSHQQQQQQQQQCTTHTQQQARQPEALQGRAAEQCRKGATSDKGLEEDEEGVDCWEGVELNGGAGTCYDTGGSKDVANDLGNVGRVGGGGGGGGICDGGGGGGGGGGGCGDGEMYGYNAAHLV